MTGITNKLIAKKGVSFKIAIKNINKFLDNKSIVICNGNDDHILSINYKINKINFKKNYFFYFYDLSKILKKIFPKDKIQTDKLLNLFNIKKKIKPHNAINDCRILNNILKKIKYKIGIKNLLYEISNNIKKFN